MVIGRIGADLCPMVPIVVQGADGQERKIPVLLSTGFGEALLLPPAEVAALGLPQTGCAHRPLPVCVAQAAVISRNSEYHHYGIGVFIGAITNTNGAVISTSIRDAYGVLRYSQGSAQTLFQSLTMQAQQDAHPSCLPVSWTVGFS